MMFVNNQDVKLAVEIAGQGEPLLFAHGLTASRKHTLRQLRPLMDRYRVISFDQRGHGSSTPLTDPASYEASEMAGDMLAVLNELGIERAIVGGDSMGCATAMIFAMAHPERVKLLLLLQPALSDQPHPERQRLIDIGNAMAAQGVDEFTREHVEKAWIADGFSPQAAEYWASILRSHQTQSLATACRTVSNWVIFSDLSELSRLRMPVRILAVKGDVVHPLALAERLAVIFPDAQMASLTGTKEYHEDVEIVGRIFRRWLDQLAG
jgi:pimeloyl-ACP methyl ester carboxylesterase